MGEVVEITPKRRSEFDDERWAITDPDTPVKHWGVIARILGFREKPKKTERTGRWGGRWIKSR